MTPLPQFTEWLKACNERFARFSGSQFSPHELPSEQTVLTAIKRVCRECRRREVRQRQRYCPDCAAKNNRQSKRRHMRRKRGLNVEKFANWPLGAEPLTKAGTQGGYHHPSGSTFSTKDAGFVP
jgi:hypothetical protein